MHRAPGIRSNPSIRTSSRRRSARSAPVLSMLVAFLGGTGLLATSPALAATWPPPSYVEPLSEIELRGGRLAWDGVAVGMTFAQVERAVERSIGSLDSPDPRPGLLCGLHHAAATVDGQWLGLEFAGVGRDAALRAITVRLEPRLGETFETAAVVDALRSRLELAFVPSPHAPRLAESEIEKPLYRVGSGELVFVDPEAGVVIGEVCVD